MQSTASPAGLPVACDGFRVRLAMAHLGSAARHRDVPAAPAPEPTGDSGNPASRRRNRAGPPAAETDRQSRWAAKCHRNSEIKMRNVG